MTILVCDDDKEIVDAIEIYLIQEGYQVVKAYDGEQALEMLRTKKIDLMVIDVMMYSTRRKRNSPYSTNRRKTG